MSLLTGFLPTCTDSEGRQIQGKLYTYEAGTNTPKDTYSDQMLSVPNPNPLDSDGAGRFFDVFLGAGGYKIVVTDEFQNVLFEQDEYYPALDTGDLATINAAIAAVSQQLSKTIGTYGDTGTADNYVLSVFGVETPPAAYANGMIVYFGVQNANTGGTCYVNVEGLGNIQVVMPDLSDPPAGLFAPGGVLFSIIYLSGIFVYMTRSGPVTTETITAAAVTGAKIEDLAISTGKIAANAVTPAKMSDGTAYKLAGYSSANAFTEYTNPMRLIDSGSFTAAASKAFVLSTLDTAQSVDNVYLLRCVGFQPTTDDDQTVFLTISTDAGSTYVSTNYYYSCAGTDSGGSAVGNTANNGAAQAQAIVLGGSGGTYGLSNAANETACLDLYLYNFNTGATTNRPYVLGSGEFWAANANVLVRQSVSASQTTAADYDAIKLTLEGGGNFAAVGKYYLYKLAGVI